ncbi:hydroxyisourate hydrolase [Oceanicella actignis]|uniref:5-hydroxyisourate hydrolase n=1 Tax=Oceanicella actignis TaxID=1189325 RepID=A0A1M7RS98_9RHOB|nr:hydroxyisourate hydrolase [Oceanicella actignis]TYO89495.1 5-hydroxyisourate hydrolase [Oceanicella actignis]SET05741.1 5-hydroxyisourate hydrolase [Oceanicella actignis]SHN49163.1 5-hydroxyisourate hydrolase [Oceanicella actignis]
MGRLTTHVLDTARGRPAAGLRIGLYRLSVDSRDHLLDAVTNEDGRCDAPLLEGAALRRGVYELVFHAGAYFDAAGLALPSPKFLSDVPVRFGVDDPDAHYHVPLLLSPYGYSTYRGS